MHLGDTVIPDNTYPSSNNIPESIDLYLCSLHICGEKKQDPLEKKKCHKYYCLKKLKGLSLIQFWRLLMINSNSHNGKYQMYSDSGRYQIPLSEYATLHDPCLLSNQFHIFPMQGK